MDFKIPSCDCVNFQELVIFSFVANLTHLAPVQGETNYKEHFRILHDPDQHTTHKMSLLFASHIQIYLHNIDIFVQLIDLSFMW